MAKKKNKDKLGTYVINKDRKAVIEKYFEYTMIDFESNLGMEYIYEQLQMYEDKELYLPCAGIKKAIDLILKNTIKDLVD